MRWDVRFVPKADIGSLSSQSPIAHFKSSSWPFGLQLVPPSLRCPGGWSCGRSSVINITAIYMAATVAVIPSMALAACESANTGNDHAGRINTVGAGNVQGNVHGDTFSGHGTGIYGDFSGQCDFSGSLPDICE
jgi:hypothetical protein